MPVDNQAYDQLGAAWWDETRPLSMLLTGLNPARFGYFRQVLMDRLHLDPLGKKALDIGCGGGFLAEEFARLGCDVVGVDPSAVSIETARAHAGESGLPIEYRVGAGEELPVADASFDIVYCCDVLEHVNDLNQVISETARVLKSGGIYFYDTINRTLVSKLVTIKLLQDWRPTRIFDFQLHDWAMYIKPEELQAILFRHGLEHQEVMGLASTGNPISLLVAFWNLKRGRITYGELGRRMRSAPGKNTSVSYMGYAIKS